MKTYKNKPQDLVIHFGVNTYKKIEELFDIQEGETPTLHFLLALLGLTNQKRIDLDRRDPKSDETRTFSLRTMYQRDETDFDTYFGLITILDNLDDEFEYIVNNIAFERTELHDKTFLKMTNVKTFYEYMLSGLDFVYKEFFTYDSSVVNVADSIHDFLTAENDIALDAIELLLKEEEDDD